MARGPRRLRNLNLEVEDAEVEQLGHDDSVGNEIEGSLQGPPNVDNILARMPNQCASTIKIICKFGIFFCFYTSEYNLQSYNFIHVGPNGQVRHILVDFEFSDLLKLQGGKVIVATDKNSVPNEPLFLGSTLGI